MKQIFLILILFPYYVISFEPKPITPYPVVGYKEIHFFDEFQMAKRNLLIWYPVDPDLPGSPSKDPWDLFQIALNAPFAYSKEKMPVIILSHGYTGSPHQLSWLIRGLVHYGFIVLAIQHLDLDDGKAHANHWRRAVDVGLIINEFTANPVSKQADLGRIGIAGFSLGGTTAVWVAGGRSTKLESLIPGPDYAAPEDYVRANEALPGLNKELMSKDWRDPRVKAAFVMAPGWAWLFDEKSLQNISIPMYFVAAAADKVLVTKNNAGFFAKHTPHAYYQEISGKANHYIFISMLAEGKRKKVDPSRQLGFLFEEDASINRPWIQFQVVDEAVKFFRSALNLSG